MFDDVVVVDFSAAASPRTGRDSIWIAHGRAGRPVATANPPTRRDARLLLEALLVAALRHGRTVLVGLDFSLGYPAGFAAATWPMVGGDPRLPPWRRTWHLLAELVEDGPGNVNNRFAAADAVNRRTGARLFWGRPTSPAFGALRALPPTDTVPTGLTPSPCPPLRLAERHAGRGIRSNFQLLGAGTVGGQVLVGIPWLAHLVDRFRPLAAVWPFETGFVDDPLARPASLGPVPGPDGPGERPRLVFAELWPPLFHRPGSAVDREGPEAAVRDEVQVRTAVEACAGCDEAVWSAWFRPATVTGLSPGQRARVEEEEGWILGVP